MHLLSGKDLRKKKDVREEFGILHRGTSAVKDRLKNITPGNYPTYLNSSTLDHLNSANVPSIPTQSQRRSREGFNSLN